MIFLLCWEFRLIARGILLTQLQQFISTKATAFKYFTSSTFLIKDKMRQQDKRKMVHILFNRQRGVWSALPWPFYIFPIFLLLYPLLSEWKQTYHCWNCVERSRSFHSGVYALRLYVSCLLFQSQRETNLTILITHFLTQHLPRLTFKSIHLIILVGYSLIITLLWCTLHLTVVIQFKSNRHRKWMHSCR